jgi:hypothetical protein
MGQPPLGFFAQKFSKALGGGALGSQADLSTSQRHGKRYWSVYGTPAILNAQGAVVTAAQAGSNFRGSNAAGAALSAALATTYTGLCLSNPAASTVNLVLKKVSGVIIVAPAAELAIGLITGWAAGGITAHTTPVTGIVSGYVGAAAASGSVVAPASQAKLDAACTLVGTPVWDRWLAAGVASTNNVNFDADVDDDLVIPPGGYVAIGANAAGPAAGFLGTFQWEELPA